MLTRPKICNLYIYHISRAAWQSDMYRVLKQNSAADSRCVCRGPWEWF